MIIGIRILIFNFNRARARRTQQQRPVAPAAAARTAAIVDRCEKPETEHCRGVPCSEQRCAYVPPPGFGRGGAESMEVAVASTAVGRWEARPCGKVARPPLVGTGVATPLGRPAFSSRRIGVRCHRRGRHGDDGGR